MRVYHRNAAIFAGLFTLVQGAVWAFFAVWSVGIYSCTFNYPYLNNQDPTVGNLFFYSYELGRCRLVTTLKSAVPDRYFVSPHRTYAIMLTYGILSAAWIPTAILVLVAAVNKIHGKKGARCYYPWLFITAAVLVMDIIGIVFYSIDISNTMTVKDYLKQFPIVSPQQVRGLDGVTVIPAVIMLIFCCRIVVIWIINAFIFGVVIQAVIALKRRSPAAEFVEREARMKPSEGRQAGSWVNIDPREGELELPSQRPQQHIEDRRMESTIIQSPSEERDRPQFYEPSTRRPEQPPFPPQRPSRLYLPPQSRIPPSPPPDPSTPIFDVTGKPTTPDSPQAVFIRTNTSNNQYLQSIDNTLPFSYTHPRPVPQQPLKGIPEPDYTLHRVPTRGTIQSTTSTPSEEEEIRPTKRFENNPNVWKVM